MQWVKRVIIKPKIKKAIEIMNLERELVAYFSLTLMFVLRLITLNCDK